MIPNLIADLRAAADELERRTKLPQQAPTSLTVAQAWAQLAHLESVSITVEFSRHYGEASVEYAIFDASTLKWFRGVTMAQAITLLWAEHMPPPADPATTASAQLDAPNATPPAPPAP